ncbi:glycosyltransferase family 4 protein [Buttiauxella agrestis]|uniref:Putative GlcNAc transferase n=1 Tax=Buttiauxella agrestis ATCC 33320 TaxID=1006004 RepID=A0A085FZV9_9ENTR|nr:glycosyltransferase family 4 protein [Buttiauxella agrestis]KFC77004.1 putative GlcNAc transferase [Buttiauxella agrestis ATCC 33320]
MQKILLLSNMYPSSKNPDFGVFVASAEKDLLELGFNVDKCVRLSKGKSKVTKVISYFYFYLKSISFLIFRNYDYIYCHYVSHTALPIIIVSLFRKKLKLVCHIHGGDVKFLAGRNALFHKIKHVLVCGLLRRTSKIICPSKYYSEYIRQVFPFIPSSNIFVYPSGGVHSVFFKNEITSERDSILHLGYAGRLVKSKNVNLIIDAIKETEGVNLTIVGSGELKKSLLNASVDLPINFLEPMNREQLSLWFNEIDVLIYPSESESLGLVPLEAMASGVYTILSKIPAFTEFSEIGLQYEVMDEFSSNAIRKCINSFISKSHEDIKGVCSNNKIIVKQIYGSENIKDVLKNVFN